ncbi:MAG: hypothetical protein OK454_08345 [Thaumarchaeota archaeon]|nr:hypothetical protein [Nitrososphaerota archaeon]
MQNENKTLQDNQVRNQNSWDEKYSTLLQKLDDYQEEKDNPRKLVVNMEAEELWVAPNQTPETSALARLRPLMQKGSQLSHAVQVAHRAVRA